MFRYANPIFWYKKRKSIRTRLSEIPYGLQWSVVHPFLKNGYIESQNYKKILNIKGSPVDDAAVLIGNGPSVRIDDLNRLEGRVTFCCNRIHLAYETMRFRPTYVLSSDEQVIQDFGQEIVDNNKEATVFFVAKKNPMLKGEYTWLMVKKGRPFRFREDVTRCVQSGGGTLISAIQIGFYMGIRKFYLYGVDHDFKFESVASSDGYVNAKGDGNHFIKNYRSGLSWQAPTTDVVEEAFIACDQFLRRNGGWLKNATRGGRLEVLERACFDDIEI